MRFGHVLLGLVTLISLTISSGQQCSNGLAGVQNGDVCCDADCGTCGGRGCGGRTGGGMNCCTSRIGDSGVMCSSSMAAPCIIDDVVCSSNGLPGVEGNGICCGAQCGTCGGSGCSRRDGGPSACCSSRIVESGVLCSVSNEAPCIIDDGVCSNGVPGVEQGDICCEAQCGTCGGSGCSRRPGGPSACCSSRIEESNVLCSMTMEAPCIIDDACSPNPCENGGSCSIDPAGGHQCSCASDFGGMSCQTVTSSLAPFFIELEFIGTWTDARRAIFQDAADRWSEVITHVPCGGSVQSPAGRLAITATLEEIDGAGGPNGDNILGFAGPTRIWGSCPTVSYMGEMTFDIFDIGEVEANGNFEGLILHEMGHVIGVGTIWDECSTCRMDGNAAWTCPTAVSTYADIGGSDADIVQVELVAGSNCGHLDETIFGDELMTPRLNNVTPLSKMTASTLDDLDYIVDPSAVDPYFLPAVRGVSINEESEMSMNITDTAVEATILVVDGDDNVVEERIGVRMMF